MDGVIDLPFTRQYIRHRRRCRQPVEENRAGFSLKTQSNPGNTAAESRRSELQTACSRLDLRSEETRETSEPSSAQ